jgi:GTPase involved in cell partitioning and DNA repair
MYNPALVNKQQVVVVNKIDLLGQEAASATVAALKTAAGHTRVLGVSAVTGENVKQLMQRLRKLVRCVELVRVMCTDMCFLVDWTDLIPALLTKD